MKIIIFGLSLTSSWGNGHATTYRSLIKELTQQGHDVLFLEHDKPWYASTRDLLTPDFCRFALYDGLDGLQQYFVDEVAEADCVMIGSYVPEGIVIGEWIMEVAAGVTVFYDIDTPITASKLATEDCFYLTQSLAGRYDLYLSFSGGPLLDRLAKRYDIRSIYPLYCAVNPQNYYPIDCEKIWDLGFLGTYSKDRHPQLEEFLIKPARRRPDRSFVVAGPEYPPSITWEPNIKRVEHLDPQQHAIFYNSQRYTLNITRADMVRAGYSPSVRMFEAAACGVPIISDYWEGIEIFFEPEKEILIVGNGEEVCEILDDIGEGQRLEIAQRARARVLREHTPAHRARKLINLILAKRTELAGRIRVERKEAV